MKKFILLFVLAIGMVIFFSSCTDDVYNRWYPDCWGCHCGSYYNDLCTCDCHWNDPYNKHYQSGRWANWTKAQGSHNHDHNCTNSCETFPDAMSDTFGETSGSDESGNPLN